MDNSENFKYYKILLYYKMKTIGKIFQVIKMNSTRDHFNMNTVIQALFKFMGSVKTGSKFSKTLLIFTQNSFKKYFEKTVLFLFQILVTCHPVKVHQKSVHIYNISELFFVDQITLVLRGTGRFEKSDKTN